MVYSIQVLSIDRIIGCSKDTSVELWCLLTNSCLKTFAGHANKVFDIQEISINSVATYSTDRTIKIWDLTSGDCIKTFQEVNKVLAIQTFKILILILI